MMFEHGHNVTRTIYRVSDGAVLRVVSCPAEQWAQQLVAGEAFVEGDHGGCERIDAQGKPVARATAPAAPQRPAHVCVRAENYPLIGDQLDELWRVVRALAQGAPVPDSAVQMLARIDAVKAAWPKAVNQDNA